jgi:hypothetical protein
MNEPSEPASEPSLSRNSLGRGRGRPFKPGVSPNPGGKRKDGTREPPSLRTMSLRDAVISAAERVGIEVDPNTEDGLESFLADVARKDRKSFVTLLNRAMPLQPVRVPLPPIEKPADLVAASSEIARAVGEGEISPGDAASISTIVGNAGRAIELHQLAERIERLEAQAEQAAQK